MTRGIIRGLSVRQPWASCIMSGHKGPENRTWTPRGYGLAKTGTTEDIIPKEPLWLALHSSKKFFDCVDLPGLIEEIAELWPGVPTDLEQYPLGHILGLAKVEGVLHITDKRLADNRWATGPICWMLGPVYDLADYGLEYLPARGRQGLWNVEPGDTAVLRDLFRRAA